MTGGLEEPAELAQAQGTLALLLGEPSSREDWERAAAAVLRKSGRLTADDPDDLVWRRLTRSTLDGLAVTPLGTREQVAGLESGVRPTRTGGWDVRVELSGADAATLNAQALAELDTGATSLWLRSADELERLLDGVLLDLAPAVLDVPTDPLGAARRLVDHLGYTEPAAGTNLGIPAVADDDTLVAGARLAREEGHDGLLAFVVDATGVHDRGASDVQELAWALAAAVRLLRVLDGAGVPVRDAARLVEFRYAATDEQFSTIAKLRAARRLWARVLEVCGAAGSQDIAQHIAQAPAQALAQDLAQDLAQRQHVVTSRPMMSKYDPYVNMLRTTVAAFAAGVAGADAITVLPFDSPLGRPDAFGRRIARNVSAVLLAEAQLGRVADAAGGAYAVERLTHDVAVAAWDLFVRLDDGEPLEPLVATTAAERERQVASRRRPLTGLTEFPHLGEVLPEREPDPAAPPVRRYGAAFEELRDAPATTPVFLATLGPVAAHTARATFATNLLAAGGIAVDVAGSTGGVEELTAAYSGQPVVCLAGPDAAYGEWGAEAAAALRHAGARHVIIAGRPVDYADDSCALGIDALAFLRRTREVLA